VGFEDLKAKLEETTVHGIQIFKGGMSTFDGGDRSMRYVGRVFDVKQTTISEEDPDLHVYALADFRSEDPGDLEFVRGDKIKVLVQHGSGWWEGEIGEKRGLFPHTFTMSEGKTDQKSDPIGAVFLVIADFEPRRGNEIPLLVGDLVHVDWRQGERCSGTNQRINKRGYFPLDNLEQKI
jgi:hypothetical protein